VLLQPDCARSRSAFGRRRGRSMANVSVDRPPADDPEGVPDGHAGVRRAGLGLRPSPASTDNTGAIAMAATTFDAAVSSVTDWLRQRPTPVCWLAGPPGAGKTAVVQAVCKAAGRTRTAPLSAASPDRCLHHAFGDRTTAGVGARLSADTPGL